MKLKSLGATRQVTGSGRIEREWNWPVAVQEYQQEWTLD